METNREDLLNAGRQKVRDAADMAEERFSEAASDLGDKVGEARQRTDGAMKGARDRLHKLDGSARRAAHEAAQEADEYVSSHPWRAVAVAVAISAIVSAVFLSRRA